MQPFIENTNTPMPTVVMAQINPHVGDLKGNLQKLKHAIDRAVACNTALLLTPEMALCGYPCEDLWLRPAFIGACNLALCELVDYSALAQNIDLTIVVGHPAVDDNSDDPDGGLFNAASVIKNGHITHTHHKKYLPNHGVFDEKRYFKAANAAQPACVFDVRGSRFALLICEDAWHPEMAQQAKLAGATALVVINASPFYQGKSAHRQNVMRQRTLETQLPLLYCHMWGGQDELLFDGASFAINAQGHSIALSPSFQDHDLVIDGKMLRNNHSSMNHPKFNPDSSHAELWFALVIAIREYVQKNGFEQVVLGLSGGIDSALVLALAVDALGAQNVQTVMMPYLYTADISVVDAKEMAERLGVRHTVIPIESHVTLFKNSLLDAFAFAPVQSASKNTNNTTEENLQARIRGTLLMAFSNKLNAMLLTTGNKSEMATGYCTLYGDMAGGFAPLKDVLKTQVFALCRWRNQNDPFNNGSHPIPDRTITRPPSAELRPDQQDSDSLPAYDILDAIINAYMVHNQSKENLLAAGFLATDVQQVVHLIRINEHKRRQSPIGPCISERAFAKHWRYPVVNVWY